MNPIHPADLPEHDPELTVNDFAAVAFLEALKPSPDRPGMPMPSEPVNRRPMLRSSHTFLVRDDVAGRDDPALNKTLTGSFLQHGRTLDKLNRERRAGIYVQLDPTQAIVAEFPSELRRGIPCRPSAMVMWQGGVQYLWLLNAEAPQILCNDIAAQLRILGGKCKGAVAHVRLPGFHVRSGLPALVTWYASADDGTLYRMPRYAPEAR